MKLKTTLFAAAATLVLAPSAYAYEGLYGAIGAGLSYMQPDRDVESTGALVFDSEADYENGIGVYTALGYAWGNNWRTELEYSFRQNDVRHWPGDGLGFAGWSDLDGGIDAHALMINAIRDFDMGGKVTPYIGAGVGVASLSGEFFGNSAGAPGGFGQIAIDDAGVKRLAYQGIAGLAIGLAEGLALDLSYRYFSTVPPKFDGTIGAGLPINVRTDYNNHSVFAGLRWNFGAAAAPVPQTEYKDCWDGSSVPVSAECPPQLQEQESANLDPIEFTVYFDYDKANLTPEAANLVREAAARALQNDIETVVVSGNTDTSGGAAYNQRLSERRATVVRDALIANGVSADRIRMEANGENNPAKPTADGVREPLNRRTEVVISFE